MNDRPSRGPLLTLTLSAKPSFRRVLSNRPFSLLWAGPLVSQSGDFIFDVAAIWYVLQLTGDPFKVGLAVATILLPANFIGPIAGVYLDRFNRRDVMLASNLVQAKVPGDMLGRVFTSLVALLTIASPISSALAGGLATSISIGGTFEIFGGLIVLACTVGYLFFRDLREASY